MKAGDVWCLEKDELNVERPFWWEPAVKGACFSLEEKGRCIAVFTRENNTSDEEWKSLLQSSGETLRSFLNRCDRGIKKKTT